MTIKLSEKDKSSIDYLLSHLQHNISSAQKYWEVTTALNSKRNLLMQEDIFLIPHNRFEAARAKDYEIIKDVLKKFHQLNIVHTTYNNKTIIEDRNIVSKDNTETQIIIFPYQFEYFRDRLKLIVKPELNIPKPLPIPTEWQLNEKGQGAVLTYNGREIITFKSAKYRKYRYFRCLWENHGLEVSSKTMFEYQSKLIYEEEKGKNYEKNQEVNHIINKLKKELYNKFKDIDCPLAIELDTSIYKLILTPIFSN